MRAAYEKQTTPDGNRSARFTVEPAYRRPNSDFYTAGINDRISNHDSKIEIHDSNPDRTTEWATYLCNLLNTLPPEPSK